MSTQVSDVTDDTFEPEVLLSEIPVLVDYWADKCQPCTTIALMLDELAKDYEGRLKITKVNIDKNRSVPASLGVRGVPTLMLFKNGKVKATRIGGLSKAQLTSFLDANI